MEQVVVYSTFQVLRVFKLTERHKNGVPWVSGGGDVIVQYSFDFFYYLRVPLCFIIHDDGSILPAEALKIIF